MRPNTLLDAETLAALGATTRENQTAAADGHASAKAVRALAVNVARLVSALHDRVSVAGPQVKAKKLSNCGRKQKLTLRIFEGRQGYAAG
jgi:hypothetical protein